MILVAYTNERALRKALADRPPGASGAPRATSCGRRARPRARPSTCSRSASTASRTPCSTWCGRAAAASATRRTARGEPRNCYYRRLDLETGNWRTWTREAGGEPWRHPRDGGRRSAAADPGGPGAGARRGPPHGTTRRPPDRRELLPRQGHLPAPDPRGQPGAGVARICSPTRRRRSPPTPGSATHLRERDHASHTFLLESVEGGEQSGATRSSAVPRAPSSAAYGRRVEIDRGRRHRHRPWRTRTRSTRSRPTWRASGRCPTRTCRGSSAARWATWATTRCSVFEPRVPVRTDRALRAPDMVFMVTDALVVFDRVRHTIKVVANAFIEDDPEAAYGEAVETIDATCAAPGHGRTRPAGRSSTGHVASCRTRVPTSDRRDVRGAASSGPRSTSGPATSSRWSSPSASKSTATATRSTSTAPCAPSIPRPTCSASNSATAPWSGPRPEIHVRCEDGRGGGAAHRRHAARARRTPEEDRRLERGTAGRPQGTRRARHAGRPGPQRHRPRLRVRVGARAGADGHRALQPRHAHRLRRDGAAARRPRRLRR